MARTLALSAAFLALLMLSACGAGGDPEGLSRVDLTEFWQRGR